MSENKKLTQEEIQDLHTIQKRTLTLKTELSEIGVIKLQIEDREKIVRDFFNETKKLENQISQVLQSKYGNGSIDLENGLFVPNN